MSQQSHAAMEMLVFLWVLSLVKTRGAQSSTCGDIYYPSTLQPAPSKFAVAAMGNSGYGKSTIINMLAGGHEMSAVGNESGYSQTEEACAFNFEYLGGESTAVANERWVALDTPGFDDTGGQSHMVTNGNIVQAALRNMGKVDAILLMWKYDEKFTDVNLGAFLALRSIFNAGIWSRVVMVYSHWAWCEPIVPGYCKCRREDDLFSVHEATMTAAFQYINEQTGDVRCNHTMSSRCFPRAQDIPFIGNDLTLSKLNFMRQKIGCDPLTKPGGASCPNSPCLSDSPSNIRKLRYILTEKTAAPGYQRLDISQITNYWVACQGARTGFESIIDDNPNSTTCLDTIAMDTAAQLQTCIEGGMKGEIEELAALISGRVNLQTHVAFFMTRKEYVVAPIFDEQVTATVAAYPDYETYTACSIAVDLNTQDAAALTDSATICWAGISPVPSFDTAILSLLTSFKSRSRSLRMAVSLNMLKCRAGTSGCLSEDFVKNVSSTEELKELSLWLDFASEGRCCALEGETWAATAGPCNSGSILWNQTNINCLQYCDLFDLVLPSCEVLSGGVVHCQLTDAFGSVSTVRGDFMTADGKVKGAFVESGQSLALSFESDLTHQAKFVLGRKQYAVCSEGTWQKPNHWELPKARQSRSCSVCHSGSECLNTRCIAGRGLLNQLWMAGDSEDAGLCYSSVCGDQQDTHCHATPKCRKGYRAKDCSTTSCSLHDCCEKLPCEGCDAARVAFCVAGVGSAAAVCAAMGPGEPVCLGALCVGPLVGCLPCLIAANSCSTKGHISSNVFGADQKHNLSTTVASQAQQYTNALDLQAADKSGTTLARQVQNVSDAPEDSENGANALLDSVAFFGGASFLLVLSMLYWRGRPNGGLTQPLLDM